MSQATANRRIDIEAPDRVTVTISATFTRSAKSDIAPIVEKMLYEQLTYAAHELRRMDRWHPDRPLADDDVLDALDTLFFTRAGTIEEEARFIPTPRHPKEPADQD